ncbi:MAG: DUF2007 domain-containing protein [bacterium]|nr:DUF2007 domain-containing protein [bacterium]
MNTVFCPNPECTDVVETGRPGEYTRGISVCPVCGAYLVDSLPLKDESGGSVTVEGLSQLPSPDEEFEPVYECMDPTEVPLVKAFLESEGIRYFTTGEEQFDAFRGGLAAFRLGQRTWGVRFLVPVTVAERTRALLASIEEPLSSDENRAWDLGDKGTAE